jgi:hypothetical protein
MAQYGGPKMIMLEFDLPRSEPSLHSDLQWSQKPANRLPEAFWFSFCPRVAHAKGWMMEKSRLIVDRPFGLLTAVSNWYIFFVRLGSKHCTDPE